MLPRKLAELFGEMEKVREETLAALSGRSEEEASRAAEGGWSAAQILYHVLMAEIGTSKVIRKTIRSASLPPYPEDDSSLSVRELSRPVGAFEAPEIVRPDDPPAGQELLRLARETRERTAATFSMLAVVDPRAARFPHPFYGELDLYEWPAVTILMHERDHQGQLRAALDRAGENPRATASQKLPRPEAVIFDFDGVIADTERLHFDTFRKVLDPQGISFTWEEYVDRYMGCDDRDAFRKAFRLAGRDLDDRQLAVLIKAKSRAFQERIREGAQTYPGALGLIRSLHASGIPLAVCSGALRNDIDPILSGFGVACCFSAIVSADNVRKGKPDPEGYIAAFRELTRAYPSKVTSTSSCLAVEDTPDGIKAAKFAGLKVLAVTNSYPAEALSRADYVADSLEDVGVEESRSR
jgi:beta-phosphoglucomutase